MNKIRSNYTAQLLKIGEIVGMFYSQGAPTDTMIIYGIGAPIPPDSGLLPAAPALMQDPVDLFVPEYIGYGRSDGVFTAMNCSKTCLDLFEAVQGG